MADFVPTSEGNLAIWLLNLTGKISAVSALLGMDTAQVEAVIAKAQLLTAELNNVGAARANQKKATATKDAQKKESLAAVRTLLVLMKANPLWTDAISKDLQTEGTPSTIDPVNYKAKVKAKLDGNGVRLRVSKKGVEAVNIYCRLQGETEFVLLEKITRSTYTDRRPLATPGIAEIRQYRVKGVIADQEVGHFSDIATISFGG